MSRLYRLAVVTLVWACGCEDTKDSDPGTPAGQGVRAPDLPELVVANGEYADDCERTLDGACVASVRFACSGPLPDNGSCGAEIPCEDELCAQFDESVPAKVDAQDEQCRNCERRGDECIHQGRYPCQKGTCRRLVPCAASCCEQRPTVQLESGSGPWAELVSSGTLSRGLAGVVVFTETSSEGRRLRVLESSSIPYRRIDASLDKVSSVVVGRPNAREILSIDDGSIHVRSISDDTNEPTVVRVASPGAEEIAGIRGISVAADGQTFAATGFGDASPRGVYVGSLADDADPPRRIGGHINARSPAIAPDGSNVVFIESRAGLPTLSHVATNGGKVTYWSSTLAPAATVVWHPSGDFLAVQRVRDGECELLFVSPDGRSYAETSVRSRAHQDRCLPVAFAPNGGYVLYWGTQHNSRWPLFQAHLAELGAPVEVGGSPSPLPSLDWFDAPQSAAPVEPTPPAAAATKAPPPPTAPKPQPAAPPKPAPLKPENALSMDNGLRAWVGYCAEVNGTKSGTALRVRVKADANGVVKSAKVLDPSGDRDFDRCLEKGLSSVRVNAQDRETVVLQRINVP